MQHNKPFQRLDSMRIYLKSTNLKKKHYIAIDGNGRIKTEYKQLTFAGVAER